jgi:hypothetical protein
MIQWKPLGSLLTLVGAPPKPAPEVLMWQGVRCELGETEVYLIDPVVRIQSGPHRVVGKFVQQRLRRELESAATLGVNFGIDNNIPLTYPTATGGATGYFAVP